MFKENTYWTGIIKKIIYVIIVICLIIFSIKLAIFYMPFLIAFSISIMIEPAIKKIMKKFRLSRKISSIIMFIVVFGSILGLLIWGISTIVSEVSNLLKNFNEYYEKVYSQIQNLIKNVDFEKLNVSKEITNIFQDTTFSIFQKISVYLQRFLTQLIKFVTSIPSIAIYFAVTVLALYFICTDKIYMIDELEHHLPEKWVKEMSIHLKQITKTLGSYLKAQITLIIISFFISLVGLYIMNFAGLDVGFPLLIALGIGFVDALPILGSGTVMIPWAIISGLNGKLSLGISIIILLITMSITRQLIEPKIVSGSIGIHPIFTIIAMYTGFKLIGILGMFVGPILLIILKNVFGDLIENGVIKSLIPEGTGQKGLYSK